MSLKPLRCPHGFVDVDACALCEKPRCKHGYSILGNCPVCCRLEGFAPQGSGTLPRPDTELRSQLNHLISEVLKLANVVQSQAATIAELNDRVADLETVAAYFKPEGEHEE